MSLSPTKRESLSLKDEWTSGSKYIAKYPRGLSLVMSLRIRRRILFLRGKTCLLKLEMSNESRIFLNMTKTLVFKFILLINLSLVSNRFCSMHIPVSLLWRQIFRKNLFMTSVADVFAWKSSKIIMESGCGNSPVCGTSWCKNTGISQFWTISVYAPWTSVNQICISLGANENTSPRLVRIFWSRVVLPEPLGL